MQIKIFIFLILNLLFSLQVVRADKEVSPTKSFNNDSFQQEVSGVNKTSVNLSQLLESYHSYPDGFSDFDLIGKILDEEKKYQTLDADAKNEYLYNKYEKIKNFSERKVIEKFLNFDFKTGSINNLSNDTVKKLNKHLPYYISEKQLKSKAFQAAALGDLLVLRALLDNTKIDINITDSNNITLLMYAAKNNQVNIARFLIARGIDIKRKDKVGNTAIAYTVPNSSIYNLLIRFDVK
jgi:hypothetical protein